MNISTHPKGKPLHTEPLAFPKSHDGTRLMPPQLAELAEGVRHGGRGPRNTASLSTIPDARPPLPMATPPLDLRSQLRPRNEPGCGDAPGPSQPKGNSSLTTRTWLTWLTSTSLAAAAALTFTPAPASAAGEIGASIIGGTDATESYPFAARLLTTYAGLGVASCTGTFVTAHGRTGVVTNAHCVSDLDTGVAMPASTVQVQTGSTHLDKFTTLQATSVDVYPTWDWGTGDDPFADVAVVNLKVPARLHVSAIPLADWVRRNAEIRLLGWGKTFSEATEPPAVLQQLDTRLTAPRACLAAGITAGEICVAPAANGGQACTGDSGGPALGRRNKSWVLLGGASRGTDESTCTGPIVYTSYVHYSRWIGQALTGKRTTQHRRDVAPGATKRFNVHIF